jgi:ubiquinol-cytochrome c reductase iron-sulfur subunit
LAILRREANTVRTRVRALPADRRIALYFCLARWSAGSIDDVSPSAAAPCLGETLVTSTADDTSRRDFLVIAGNTFAAVGAASLLWPFVQQMNPDASAQALASIEVDLAPVKQGAAITVMWRGKPVFIRNRTTAEIEAAEKVNIATLPDQTDAADSERVKKDHANWLVLVGICTHLGCIPKGQNIGDAKGEFGGWFCPCHGSHYDTSGRIRKGPAPRNLVVPPYEFVEDTKIKIG